MDVAATEMDIIDIACQLFEKGTSRDLDISSLLLGPFGVIGTKPFTMMQVFPRCKCGNLLEEPF